jgi:peptide/nickel transport system substrate-binding protein
LEEEMKSRGIAKLFIASVLGISFALIGFGSCDSKTGSAVTANTPTKTSVMVGIDGDFGDISPFGVPSGGRSRLLYQLYEYLAIREDFGCEWSKMELVCAKSIKQVDDVTFHIELYDYIVDHANNKITAEDWVWACGKNKELGNWPKADSFIASVKAIDTYTVEIKIPYKGMGMLENVLMTIPVVSRAAYEASGDGMIKNPVSTAPYRLTELIPGSTAKMVKNEGYWQKEASLVGSWSRQNLGEINFKVITEPAQMTISLEIGDIDVGEFVTPAELANFSGKDQYSIFERLEPAGFFLLPNCSDDSPCNDLLVRQAIFYAIDRQTILDAAADGHGKTMQAVASYVASDFSPSWDNRDYFKYNPEKSRQLLAQAGYKPGDLKLRILVINNGSYVMGCQVIQQQLAEIGIDLQINSYDAGLFATYWFDQTKWDIVWNPWGCDDYVTFTWGLFYDASSFRWGGTSNWVYDDKLQDLWKQVSSVDTHSDVTVKAFEQHLEDNAYGLGGYQNLSYIVGYKNIIKEWVVREGGDLIPGSCIYNF